MLCGIQRYNYDVTLLTVFMLENLLLYSGKHCSWDSATSRKNRDTMLLLNITIELLGICQKVHQTAE